MKLETVKTVVKNNAIKLLATAALAGAALTTATPAAQAQRVYFGVNVGGPAYYYRPAPPVYRPYFAHGYWYYHHPYGWRRW
jgi:hypothetical protein